MENETFVDTSVSRAVFETIDVAHQLRQNASIVGRPGVGKTFALLAYAHERRAAYIEAGSATGYAFGELLSEIAERLGVYVNGSIASKMRQLSRYDLAGQVLIIDEAQNLKLQSYRELLTLYEHAGLIIVFCGNEEVLKHVNTDKGAFAQISRRVKLRLELNSITDDDADSLAAAFGGLDDKEAQKLTRKIGAAFHADGVATVMRVARTWSGVKSIKADHIRRACEPFPQYRSALK